MKTNHLIKFAASLMLCCMFFGCTPEEEKLGTIYGTVTDFSSGEPINNANVRLNPRGETTLTGMDGTFEFVDLPKGSYSLSLSKNGYVDLDDDYVIKIESGNAVQRAIQLQKLHYSLEIVDNDGNAITILDFGVEEGVTQKTFNISNNGNMALDFTITENADWIDEVNPSTGRINVGDSKAVTVRINRELLSDGENNTSLVITTPNLGGVEVAVKAAKYGVPAVTTENVTNITHNTAACMGSVVSDGGSYVTERGICWSTAPNPTINDFKKTNGSGLGSYNCEMTDLTNNTMYYVKAYAKNSYGISYGEEKSFTTNSFPTFQYGGYTYYVAPDPGSEMTWSMANSYCNNLTLMGMSGWKMPTRDELAQMYADRSNIGGFYNNWYWTSITCDSGRHYYVSFNSVNSGNIACFKDYDKIHVRPIRRKN